MIGNHSNKCPLDGNNLLTWSSKENAPIIDKWNTRADGWISIDDEPICNGLDSIPVDVFTSDQGRIVGCTYFAGIGCYWHLLGEIENVTHYMYQPPAPSVTQ